MSDSVVVLVAAAERDIHDSFLWYRERNVLAADATRAVFKRCAELTSLV